MGSATAANAADWKQAHEVLCAVDKTANECEYDACPTVSQPTVAPGVAEEDCSSFKLVKTGAECLSSDSQLPAPDSPFRYATAAECAAAVQAKGGKFFIYGTGDKKGACYQEDTKSEDCEEGWETDQYDFYKFQQPESQPVVDEDMCECTGESNEYECTKTGKAHCNKDAVCDGIDEVKLGDLASLEAKLCTLKASLDMCKCTGSSNEYECTVTGKGHCANSEKCNGSVVKFGEWSNLCGACPNGGQMVDYGECIHSGATNAVGVRLTDTKWGCRDDEVQNYGGYIGGIGKEKKIHRTNCQGCHNGGDADYKCRCEQKTNLFGEKPCGWKHHDRRCMTSDEISMKYFPKPANAPKGWGKCKYH